jgi:hypothetical protein
LVSTKALTAWGGTGPPGAAADLVLGGPALVGRHVHGAGQVQEVGGAGQDRPVAFDAEDDVVALAQPERLADRPGDRDLPLGGEPGRDVQQVSDCRVS